PIASLEPGCTERIGHPCSTAIPGHRSCKGAEPMRAKLHRRLIVEQLESRELLSTFYVATIGTDGSTGSKAAPWQTLQHAVDAINPGDTILVESGTYAGFRIGRSGQAGAVCTLKADTGASVIVNTPGAANKHGSDIEVESFGSTVTN